MWSVSLSFSPLPLPPSTSWIILMRFESFWFSPALAHTIHYTIGSDLTGCFNMLLFFFLLNQHCSPDGLPLVVMVTVPDEGWTKRLTTLSSRAFTAFQNFRSVSQKLSSFQTSCMMLYVFASNTKLCVCSTENEDKLLSLSQHAGIWVLVKRSQTYAKVKSQTLLYK